MDKGTRKPLNETEQDAIAEKAYYDALDEQYKAEQAAKEAYARELYMARRTTEIKAKLYDVAKSYYSDLDGLAKRLQDDYAGEVPFEQTEEDRLGLCFMLDYMDDLENEINEIQEETHVMTDKRKMELLGSFVGWFLDHQTSDEGLYRDLHVEVGMTKEEMRDFGIEGLDEMFDKAEKEHQKEVDEATDLITAEDIVEQVVYAANAPECCEDEHAKNMLGMLGANVVDEDIYHDEDDCPKMDMGGMK